MNTFKTEIDPDVLADCDILIHILETEEKEFKNLEELQEVEQDISKLREAREKCIKEEIENLTRLYEKEQQSFEDVEESETYKELKQLKQDLESTSDIRDGIKQDIDKLQQKIKEQTEIMEEYLTKHQALDDKINRTIPSSQYDLKLYHYLSGIKWQMDAEEHEIRGYVVQKKKVKTFSLNRLQNSQFFITNYLWDMLEPDW